MQFQNGEVAFIPFRLVEFRGRGFTRAGIGCRFPEHIHSGVIAGVAVRGGLVRGGIQRSG